MEPERVRPTPEDVRRRRARSIALALVLAALAILFYIMTFLRFSTGSAAGFT